MIGQGKRPRSKTPWAKLDDVWNDYLATRSDAARNKLAETFMPLVLGVAQNMVKRLPPEVDIDDLIQAGTFGLLDSIKRFEPSRGLKFGTYAAPRVRGAILDYIRRVDRLPRNARHRLRQCHEAYGTFAATHGRPPSPEELRDATQLSPSQFRKAVRDETSHPESLSKPTCSDEQDGEAYSATTIDPHSDRAMRIIECKDLLSAILRDFSVTEALFIRMYYIEGLTLVEAGKALGKGDRCDSTMSLFRRNLMDRLRTRYAKSLGDQMAGRAA